MGLGPDRRRPSGPSRGQAVAHTLRGEEVRVVTAGSSEDPVLLKRLTI